MATNTPANAEDPATANAQPPQSSSEPPVEGVPEIGPEDKPSSGPPVVGMGASAGGLDAFKKFFAAMPANSGIAFVLIPHLDPKHESLMPELLARHTTMPVTEAADGTTVVANHVFILPPNRYMTISGDVLRLTGPIDRTGPQTSIDLFLRSLAEQKREKAICIILSGTGAHGTLGLNAIKATGGLGIVQDPATADYPAMPQNAIATGLADYILPVGQMPAALIEYIQHDYVSGGKTRTEADEPDDVNQVLAIIRARTKLDFRVYRKKMIARRIDRRMSLSHFRRRVDYLNFLREHPDEIARLSRDLLISVTSFFRDPEAWRVLQTELIAPMVRAKESGSPIRIWSAGCATGEEAYSLGILVLEQLAAAQKQCPVQIFATDVDDDALEIARHAIYPESISTDVSSERLARFFTRVSESSYQVCKQLREIVTVARQNLLADAPFSKLDLVVCRNLLIYLELDVQKKVLSLLHFALLDGGSLFLGSSETIGRSVDLFESLSTKWRIYRRIGPTRANNLQFPTILLEGHPIKWPTLQLAPPLKLAELTQNALLHRFALACVVINRNYEVLHFAGPTESYLVQPTGPPTHDLLALARPGLESKLRVVIQRAIRENAPQRISDVLIHHAKITRRVNIDVESLNGSKQTDGLLLVSFKEQPNSASETPTADKEQTPTGQPDIVRQLEQELETTREDLQGMIDQLESSNEELKASNEEIMSMNEELQSANEELETSKEELQSLNEELSTVNNQLHDKVLELEITSNDIINLFNCTDIATLFLDSTFRIRRFTPAATNLFKFIATDVGRSIRDIVKHFADNEMLRDAEQVLHKLAPREVEVRTEDGIWYIRRIVPYRTQDNRIDGVVITFVDITHRKRDEEAQRDNERRLAAELTAMTLLHELVARLLVCHQLGPALEEVLNATITVMRADMGNVQLLNPSTSHMEIVAQRGFKQDFLDHFSAIDNDTESVCGLALKNRTRVVIEDVQKDDFSETYLQIAAAAGYRAVQSTPLLSRDGVVLGMLSTHYREPHRPTDRDLQILNLYARQAADFIERQQKDEALNRLNKSLEAQVAERTQTLRDREERLASILNTAADAILTINHEGIIQSANPATERLFGYTAGEMRGQNVKMLMPSPYHEEHDGYLARYLQTGERRIIDIGRDVEARRKDGSVFQVGLAVSEIKHLGLFTGILHDISKHKQLEREVVEIASLEQRRIGHDLHDTVAQELTALNLLAKDLIETLRTNPTTGAILAERIAQGLQRSQQELRAVLRGLLPVAVEIEGLMASLADLADRTREDGKMNCTFDCPEPVAIADNLIATHLYLIAQEAVHNAMKHAKPRLVRISLEEDHRLTLRVRDDGIGMPAQPTEFQGLGLRIMHNRASIINATLTIEPTKPTGTVVTCTLARRSDVQKESH